MSLNFLMKKNFWMILWFLECLIFKTTNPHERIRAAAGVFVLRYTGKSLTFKEIAAIQKEIATILRPKNIPIDFNSLDVADLWIKKLLEHFPDRIEYIHYKKI